jgi:hypothetical protein
LGDRTRERRERCLDLADHETKLGAEYRRNARGSADMLRIAAWHEFMSSEFVRAAGEPWGPIPSYKPFPPNGWMPLAQEEIPNQ